MQYTKKQRLNIYHIFPFIKAENMLLPLLHTGWKNTDKILFALNILWLSSIIVSFVSNVYEYQHLNKQMC